MPRRLAVALLALTLALAGSVTVGSAEVPAPAGCPPASSSPVSATSGAAQPTATGPPAAGTILVCVGSLSITGAQFAHWLAIAVKAQPTSATGQSSPAALDSEVLDFLIAARWQVGEAEHLKVQVTRAQVEHSYTRIRNEQFPKHREFEAFLRSSGQSVGDLKFRVKLNLLSQRMIKRVVTGHRGTHAQQRALARFIHGFTSRWRARTYCAAEYLTRDCGHALSAP